MASDFKISLAARNAAMQGVVDLIESGDGGAYSVNVRTGSPPTSVSDARTGSSLATIYSTSAFSSVSNGAATATINDGIVEADGIAGYFTLYGDAINIPIAQMQGTCGDAGDAPVDLQFNNKNLVAGGSLTASITITMPE